MEKGDASARTGVILLLSSLFHFALALDILNVITFTKAPTSIVEFLSQFMDIDDMLPMKVLIPLGSVPYLIWRIVRHVSLELYLSN